MNTKTMMTAMIVAVAAMGAFPLANAGTGQTTPVAATCVNANTDSCATTWATGPVGQYVLSIGGVFQGSVTLTAASHSNPSIAFTIACNGVLAGGVMAQGGCLQSGLFPFGAIDISCVSEGTGAATCSAAGA
jgi:hypothetical protein